MAERPEIVAMTRLNLDDVHVVVRTGSCERTFKVHADRRPPLTVLVAEEDLQTAVREWPDLYRELIGRCRELLRPSGEAVAA